MNKNLIIGVLNAYNAINNGCLTIITNNTVFNDCRIRDLDLNLVYIRNKDDKLFRIELNDIIGLQFVNKRTIVGM